MKKNNTNSYLENDDEQGGGQTGEIEFKDFLSAGPERDDLLSGDQLKVLLQQHANQHQTKVYHQKSKQEQIAAVKAGQLSVESFRHSQAQTSGFKANPVLKDKIQFHVGQDKETNLLAENNRSEANPENRYTLQKKQQPENAPVFNPKPNPF